MSSIGPRQVGAGAGSGMLGEGVGRRAMGLIQPHATPPTPCGTSGIGQREPVPVEALAGSSQQGIGLLDCIPSSGMGGAISFMGWGH